MDEKNENGDLGIDMVVTMSPLVRARAVGGCGHLRTTVNGEGWRRRLRTTSNVNRCASARHSCQLSAGAATTCRFDWVLPVQAVYPEGITCVMVRTPL